MKKLYVGNLPFQATDQEITNWFQEAGATVASVSLVTDKFTGQPRGFASWKSTTMKRRAALSRLLTVRTSRAAMSWLTKLAHVKAAVVVAVTAVEGADVRAEGEAVNGVEVVAEDAIDYGRFRQLLSFAKILSVRDFNRIQSCCPQAECDSKLA